MVPSEFKTGIIALASWRAAKDELHSVMLAVTQVFMNRAAASGSELYEQSAQWLYENPGEFPDPREPQFRQFLSKLDSVTSGLVPDKTDGALWFVPQKTIDGIELDRAFTVTTTIGNLVFLR